MNTNLSLYELIKQESQKKNRKVKIIADWDECLQTLKPAAIYELLDDDYKLNTSLKEFFKIFWDNVVFSDNSPSGGGNERGREIKSYSRNNEEEKKAIESYEKMKTTMRKNAQNYKKSFYGQPKRFQAPFTNFAEELLWCLKEDLISELIIISSYRKDKPNAIEGKKAKIQRTFGKFPNTKLELTETAKDLPLTQREKVIESKYSDFDILVDDSLKAISKTKKIFPDKKFIMPNYEFARRIKKENVCLAPISLSDLKDEDFAKAAEECKQKQAVKSAPVTAPESSSENRERERERENIWKQPYLYLAFASGVGICLLGMGIYWMLRRKIKKQ